MTAPQAEETAAPAAPDAEQPPAERPASAFNREMVNDVQVNLFGARIENALLGAQTVTGGPRTTLTRATGLVDDDDVRAALARFVAPEGFAGSEVRLGNERLLVLCGPPGTGKRLSALALLRAVTGETLYMLSPNTSPADLADYEYERGCGYLVVDRVVDKGSRESDFEWRLVRDRVVDHGCYLVITQPAADVPDSSCHVAWSPPAAERLLRAYWTGRLPAAQQQVLAEVLGTVDSVRDVVGLARQLDGGRSLEEALEHLDSRVRAEVEHWFDQAPARREVVEVTTLAFAAGVDERTFEAALRALRRALGRHVPEPPTAEDVDQRDQLPQLRRRLLANELVGTETLHTELGTRGALKFAKPEHHRHVLAQLWQRMDVAFWDAVADWLDEIVTEPRYEVSVALGIAELTPIALDEVVPILSRWARGSRHAAGQRAVVYALHLMAYDDSLAPTALQVATGWITRGNPSQRWVAAMSFIGGLGVRYPHDARRRLWQVCVQSHTVDGDVEQVFGELFATLVQETGNAHLVLDFLAAKVDRFTAPGARPAGRAVAMRTALAVLESRQPGSKRSAVLVHLDRFPQHARQVGHLLSSVLVYRPMRLRAIGVLRWLLEDMARNDSSARRSARLLGTALRTRLHPDEQDPLEQDFRIVVERRKDTDIKSLVDAVLDAIKGRFD
ncbi:hypothetical protein AB0I60_11720 [Actinosynnema sp. NPDC050436]|uniref:hypothetical protein n=1 Tax=Actinosynnema sp. NPDC050436 TaxID=3155659 RepID=UPI0033DE5B1B